MRQTTSISLPKEFNLQLERIAKRRGLTKSEMIREALREYLVREEFQGLRRDALLQAQRKGLVLSDQDIFNGIS